MPIEANVIAKDTGQKDWLFKGTHTFAALPRAGELIHVTTPTTPDESCFYRVDEVANVDRGEDAILPGIDLYVEFAGTAAEMQARGFASSPN
jgi:hypothetical protein